MRRKRIPFPHHTIAPRFNISSRHGSRTFAQGTRHIDIVYACDINRYAWNPSRGFYESVRIATVPMSVDGRDDQITSPSYAVKLLNWHQRRTASL